MKTNKIKELLKNTIIIYIGRFCTQFISFFLVPIYTNLLSTADYGYVDLLQTYITLLVPIIIFRFDSGVFRFLIDERNNEKNKDKIISNTIFVITVQIVILLILFAMCNSFFDIKYFLFVILNIVALALSTICLQISRGLGKNVDYSISSIICGLTTVIVNIVFITILKKNASYILLASCIGNLLCSIYLFFRCKIYKYVHKNKMDIQQLKQMLKYSIPMIPDGLSWWIVNASDRTIISILIGNSFNGIFAVSHKFANIISSFSQVFNMTWQESASKYINEDDKDAFFSKILNDAIISFSILCLLLMSGMALIYKLFVGHEYFSSYYYIPILLFGNFLTVISGIFGGVYIAKKQTKSVAKTTMMAAIVNIIVHFILIRKIKLWAACISTLISYSVLTLYRYYDVKKYVNFHFNIKNTAQLFILYCETIIIYYFDNVFVSIMNIIVIFIFVFVKWKYKK